MSLSAVASSRRTTHPVVHFRSILGHLADHQQTRPDQTAFRDLGEGENGNGQDGNSVTFSELANRAVLCGREIREALRWHTPSEIPKVVLQFSPGIDYIAALLGCWAAGAAAVPAYPPRTNRHSERLRRILDDCRPDLILAAPRHAARVASISKHLSSAPSILEIDSRAPTGNASLEGIRIDPNSTALIQYTSGSTGSPKGVVVSHGNLIHNIEACLSALPEKPTRAASWLPPYHDMGLISKILLPIHAGIETVLFSPFGFIKRPGRWLQVISDYRVSASSAPDFAYDLCARRVTEEEKQHLDLSCWKIAFSGSEPVHGNTLRSFADAFEACGFDREAFYPAYGLAEATLCVTMPERRRPLLETTTEDGRTFVGCGKAIEGMTVKVVDPQSETALEDGKEGEIWISGPSVTQGYLDNRTATRNCFGQRITDTGDIAPFLRTGDLGFLEDGELFVTGRIKDLLILNGQNVHPEDIEHVVSDAHPILRSGGVAAFRCTRQGREGFAVAAETPHREMPDYPQIAREIREACADQLDLSPAAIVFVREWSLPRTTSGKLQRNECSALFEAGWDSLFVDDSGSALPEAAAEAPPHLVESAHHAMAGVFEGTAIEPDTSFFELGGHSLTATRIASRLSADLGIEVPIRLLFDAPTPIRLAKAIMALDLPPAHLATIESPVEKMPLTASQRRMWFQYVSNPESIAYNVGGNLEIRGAFDTNRAVTAFKEILKMHPVLRATFTTEAGFPVQRISPLEVADLSEIVVDLSDLPEAWEAARTEANRLSATPFQLETGPLYRFRVFQLRPDCHIIAVNLHHTVVDGWGVGLLVRDFFRFYNEADRVENFTPSEYQSLGTIPEEALEAQLQFWNAELENLPEGLDLPVDHTPPQSVAADGDGDVCRLSLPDELLAEIQQAARRCQSTPFMLFLAAFEVLLARYSRQCDFILAVPVANRNRTESEEIVTSLVNTLPVRAQLHDDPGLGDLIDRVKEKVLDVLENQNVPLETIVDGLARSGEGADLFRVMFDYQDLPLPDDANFSIHVDPWETFQGQAQFDLSLFVSDIGEAVVAAFEYRPSLFERSTIERMASHYVGILRQIVLAAHGESAGTVFSLPILSNDERETVIRKWNQTTIDTNQAAPFLHNFASRAASLPNATAISCGHTKLSYAKLDRESNRVACYLGDRGIGHGDRVAIYIDRSLELAVVLLGILKSGACHVPLDPDYPIERVRTILEDASPKAIVTQSQWAKDIACGNCPAILIDSEKTRLEIAGMSDLPVEITVSPEDLAYIIFTSGSTGRPKGVEISHRGLKNFLVSMSEQPGFDQGDALLAVTTISFDISGLELLLPLTRGGRVHIATREEALDGDRLAELIEQLEITHLQATPATWQLLITCGWAGKRSGRPLKMLCGGEEMPRELAGRLLNCGGELWNLYGPTETTIWSTVKQITCPSDISIGRPIANTRCYLLDENHEPVPPGAPGELFIAGDGVARGYHRQPELTAERFVSDPFSEREGATMYRTGDLARYGKEGELHYLGRLDHQVKIRGHRIELGEISSILDRHKSVRRSVVTAVKLPGIGKALVGYVEPVLPDGEASVTEFLRAELPAYMVPVAIVSMDQLPQTPNGKIDRKQLPLPEMAGGSPREFVAPRNELERRIVEIWQEVLKIDSISIRDDFFALGGHSLLAAQAFVRMRDELGIDLPLKVLFQTATVESLARIWEKEGDASDEFPAGINLLHDPSEDEPDHHLIWVHTLGGGGGGGLLSYRQIARELGHVRSYGIRETGESFSSLDKMAARYADRLGEIDMDGPVSLAGFCFGGNLALEIARHLKQGGREIANVFMMDARPFGKRSSSRPPGKRDYIDLARRLIGASPEERKRAVRQAGGRMRQLISGGNQPAYIPVLDDVLDLSEYPEKYREIARRHWILLQSHQERSYDGDLHILASQAEDAESSTNDGGGWQEIATVHAVTTIPGHHHEFMRNSTMLGRAADAIRSTLKKGNK